MTSEGRSFQFALTARDVDGSVAAIAWDFGDGVTLVEHSPSHTYAAAATYLISCTVTDDDGVSTTQYKYSVPLAQSPSSIIVDDDAPGDPVPGDPTLGDPEEDGSADHPFDTIQEGIDRARTGRTVLVMPGAYRGQGNRDLDVKGKFITVRSQAGPETSVIDCEGLGRGFNFQSGGPVVEGLTIMNGKADNGGAISCTKSSNPTIRHCVLIHNSATLLGGAVYSTDKSSPTVSHCVFANNSSGILGGAVHNVDGTVTLTNCTFHGNTASSGGGAVCNASGTMTVRDCILWGNTPTEITAFKLIAVTYSNIRGGFAGKGNTKADPLFADAANGDYHLKSKAGRWDPVTQGWATDDVTSPCIDAGDPSSPVGDEPEPNGGRINMGVYGGTKEASKSESI